MTDSATTNQAQSAYWGGVGGGAWIDLQEQMDGQLQALGDAAIDVALVALGDRVLDVGCGCGATTLALAQLVGPSGSVVGCDISEPMLQRAAQRSAEANMTQATFAATDVQTAELPGPFDVVFSRFGVMFFADPVAAFANMRAATRVGGHLSFVCWQSAALNDSFSVVSRAGIEVLGPPEPLDPDAPGPNAFADPARIRAVLSGSGWTGVEVVECRRQMQVFGTTDLEAGVEAAMRIGWLARRLADEPEDVAARARAAVRAAIEQRWTSQGWMCDGVCWLVTASN